MRVPGLDEKDLQFLNQTLRELAQGGTNSAGGPIVLGTGTTTVFDDPLCTAGSMVTLSPLTASAAGAGAYVSAVGPGTFTLGHIASAASDRSFRYEIRRK